MIYVGFLNFGHPPVEEEILIKVIGSLSQESPSIVHKNSLVLCYGKLSHIHDMDEIWENDCSLLIGRAFYKEHSSILKKETFKSFASLDKEAALSKIWGKYVYLRFDQMVSQFEIVVDSTGQLPFFYYPFSNGSFLFSSDIEILLKVLNKKPEYNWEYLCSYLIYGNSSAVQTPFKNVFELPPACCLRVTKHERNTIPFWNPFCSYKDREIQSKDVVNVLQDTLKPWIEPYKNICVSLSGGLDSSSLVYCLRDIIREDQNLTALNYFHSQIKSFNELIHARRVCKEVNIKLIELDASLFLPFDIPQKNYPLKPNKPFPGLISLKWLNVIHEHIPSTDSFTFLSGHGSDHIFMRPPSKKSTSDYLLERGFKGYKEQLENIAQYYRDPLYSIFKENVNNIWAYLCSLRENKRDLKNFINKIPQWIKQEARQNATHMFIHPVYNYLPKRILPGKYEQVDAIYEGLASIHVAMEGQSNPTYYPYFYQPVVEFALSFPTYNLFNKGYDRYPLRKSVSDTFKTSTVWRRDKSQSTGLFQLGIKRNLEYVLELCLQGHFAKQGLIDKDNLHNTINHIANGDIKYMWPFMHLTSAEIFLQFWDTT